MFTILSMKICLLFLLLAGLTLSPNAQKPRDGTYTFTLAFEEWGGESLGATCTVIIKQDSIFVIHDGSNDVTGQKGSILDKGLIMKHKSGKWIIAHSEKDRNAEQIGGCGNGPAIINFKKKIYLSC